MGEASTSAQGQTIVTVAQSQLDGGQVVTSQPQQVVMTENPDGTNTLSIAHVQTLSGQTLSLANLNQVHKKHNYFEVFSLLKNMVHDSTKCSKEIHTGAKRISIC